MTLTTVIDLDLSHNELTTIPVGKRLTPVNPSSSLPHSLPPSPRPRPRPSPSPSPYTPTTTLAPQYSPTPMPRHPPYTPLSLQLDFGKQLLNLRRLNLARNRIAIIPSGVAMPPKIEELDIRFNQLMTISTAITKCKGLHSLALSFNPLTKVVPEVG